MTTYANLTQEERDIVEAWERNFRGWVNDLARLMVAARALDASYDAAGATGAIVATLDPGEEIPNTGGLAGALPLQQDTDFAALVTGLNNFLSTYDTAATRQRIAQAVGPTAGIG